MWDGYAWENSMKRSIPVLQLKIFKILQYLHDRYWKAFSFCDQECWEKWEQILFLLRNQMLSFLANSNFFLSLHYVAHQGHQQEAALKVSAWKLWTVIKKANTPCGDRWHRNQGGLKTSIQTLQTPDSSAQSYSSTRESAIAAAFPKKNCPIQEQAKKP